MDVALLTVGVLLMIAGIAGCILPFIPGPPLSFLALLIQQFQTSPPYTRKFLWIWAGITLVVTLLDYVIPVYGTRRYGGSQYGVWGCIVGLIFGLWFGPLGIIAGPFVGAFIGELIANNNTDHALRAAMGSFIGFIVGTLLKLIACFVMVYYFIQAF
jgi:uncharacterized protein YqgC (DUF456 family)